MSNKKSSIDVEVIRQLAELLGSADIHEIEVEDEDVKIRLARSAPQVVQPQQQAMTYAASAPAMPQPSAPAASPSGPASSDDAPADNGGTPVPSPMVGTAYLASAPGAEPYARAGQKVSKGQTIMIVEAMKTMNQIPAPQDGVVKSVCVEDGQPVEYGEALILLD